MAYRLRYSDYTTTSGPPDPAEWVGPPGPPGPPGPMPPGGPFLPLSGGTISPGPLVVPSVAGNTFYLDYAPPHPSVTRLGDRVTVAAANNYNLTSGGGSTWASTIYANGYLERDATLSAVSNAGGFAIYGAARASDWKITGASKGGYGLAGFGVADAPASMANGAYLEARITDNTSVAYGLETVVANHVGSPPIVNPYAYISGGLFTCGYISSIGVNAGTATIYDGSAAMVVSAGGGVAWRRGLLFGATSLHGTNGADSGTGYAINLARNHAIRWDTSASDVESVRIQSTATGQAQKLLFTDSGVQFQRMDNSTVLWNLDMSGNTTMSQLVVGVPTGYPTITLNKTAGTGAQIQSQTSGSTRWVMRLGDNDAEGAGNTGSSFSIYRYDNTGAFIDQPVTITRNDGMTRIYGPGGLFVLHGAGFFGTSPLGVKPTVTGAKGGNAALASLMTALAAYGLVTDSTS